MNDKTCPRDDGHVATELEAFGPCEGCDGEREAVGFCNFCGNHFCQICFESHLESVERTLNAGAPTP